MRAVLYPRVSSLIQQDRHTIDSQLSELPKYVEQKGWTLVRPADTYVDDGRSAKTGTLARRVNFLKLLDDAQQTPRPFDVVVVIDAKRLTRTESWKERGTILGVLQDAGIKIFIGSTGQLLDLNTDEGDLLMSLDAHFAAKDNRSRRESVMRGKVEAIKQGRKPSGPTPFGYVYVAPRPGNEKWGWSLDQELAPIVGEIYRRICAGESCEAIASDLQARGVPRARPSYTRKRKPGRWSRERVWQIVRNTLYKGEWVADKGRALTIHVPPIVDEETWGAADVALRRFGLRGRKRTKHPYLVQGLAVCAECGARIGCASTASGARDRRKLRYYICSRRRRPGEGSRCTLPMLRADEIDARVWTGMVDFLARPGYVQAAIRRQRESEEEGQGWAKDFADVERKLRTFDERCEKMVDSFRRGILPEKMFERHLVKARADRAVLERQMMAARQGIDLAGQRGGETAAILEAAATLQQKLVNATSDQKRSLVEAVVTGEGGHVVTLGAKTISMKLLVAAEPQRLPTFAAG